MADKTISDLTGKSSLDNDDLFEIETSAGNSRKILGSALRARYLLAEHTYTGSEATHTTGTLATGFKALEIEMLLRSAVSAANATAGIRFNGDTGSNYKLQRVGANGTNGANLFTATTFLNIDIPGNNATPPANTPAMCVMRFMEHEGTTFTKAGMGNCVDALGTGATNYYSFAYGGYWLSTAAIATVTILESAGNNFVAGSLYRIWGLR